MYGYCIVKNGTFSYECKKLKSVYNGYLSILDTLDDLLDTWFTVLPLIIL